MKTRPFGPLKREVPLIGQGTWQMEQDAEGSIRALRLGIDLGLTHIDTAEIYGGGVVETIVGKGIKGHREDVFLVSKVWPSNASRHGTIRACEASLMRLGTDYLDVYLLHWPSSDHPLEETLGAFKELQRQGKILNFGVSNFDVERLKEALNLVRPGELVCNQVEYNLRHRGVETEILATCRDSQVALVGYRPFRKGALPAGSQVIDEVARKHNATPYQVALMFLTRLPNSFAIPKAAGTEHLRANAAADLVELTEEDINRIDAAFPIQT